VKTAAPAKKAAYSLDVPVEIKVETPKPVKEPKPAPQPKLTALPKPPPPPKPKAAPKPVESDANAGLVGIALGGAPLLVAPLVALTAGRSLLSKTVARREQIQKEIAEAAAAKEKKRLQSQVDPGALVKATVRGRKIHFPTTL
jgi:hypothetical protein